MFRRAARHHQGVTFASTTYIAWNLMKPLCKYRMGQKNLTVFNEVTQWRFTFLCNTCFHWRTQYLPFYFSKFRDSDISHDFSNTAPLLLDDFPSPDESSAPGLLRLLPLFFALGPRWLLASRLKLYFWDTHIKITHRWRHQVNTQAMKRHRHEKLRVVETFLAGHSMIPLQYGLLPHLWEPYWREIDSTTT
jgi:hypothetical protein